MAILTIDEIHDRESIHELIRFLIDALEFGEAEVLTQPGHIIELSGPQPSASRLYNMVQPYNDDMTCHDILHRDGCSCTEDAMHTDPRHIRLLDAPPRYGAVPFVPCPRQGLHRNLLDCWACWSDVERGALPLFDALATGEVA